MGCCTAKNNPQPRTQEQPKQVQSKPEAPQQPPQVIEKKVEWFKEEQRKDAGSFSKYEVIGGLPKSSKYGGRVQVFEIQQKGPVNVQDVRISVGTGKEKDPISQIVGAIKTITFNSGSNKDQEEAQIVQQRLQEVKEKLEKIQDDKIVKFDFNVARNEKGHFFVDIFMPFAPFGTVEDEVVKRIKNNKNYFKASEVLAFMDNSLKAFQSLQEQKIQHQDIKPQNFLLLNSDSISEVRVSDFRAVPDFISAFPNQASEHFEYTAPKLRESQQEVQHQPYKSDLFSLGLTWLRVATLWDVQGINTKEDIAQRLESLNMIVSQQSYSSRVVQMITKALNIDENSRPDFVSFESPAQSDKSTQKNPTLLHILKDQKNIDKRLQKQNATQPDNNLSDNLQGISQNQNQLYVSYYPAGDEEEHLEDQSQQVEQSELDLKNQLEAQRYGGEFVPLKSNKTKVQANQATEQTKKDSEQKSATEEKKPKEEGAKKA